MTTPKRWALITGGSSGLGLACAKALAPQFDLALSFAANVDRAVAEQKGLRESHSGLRVELFQENLNGSQAAQRLFHRAVEIFGTAPSVLINSAGRLRDGLFISESFETHESMIQEHLVVPMALTQLAVKAMYREKWGRVINVSSVSAKYFKKGQVNYAAAKSGLEGFSRCLALEVAHRGVTVNVLAPGLIETPMTAEMIRSLENEKLLKKKIPAGRVGRPEDVGSLVQYLCSDSASYMTGTVLTLDGGRSLGDASL